MEKILITGANGFLGKYILREVSRGVEKPEERIVTLGLSENNNLVGDLTRAVPPLSGEKFSTVYHVAGTVDNDKSRLLNVVATNNLLTALEANPPESLVFFSTTELYGLDEGENIGEDASVAPRSEFAMSKQAMEINVGEWAKKHSVKLTVIRLPMVIGTGMNGASRRLLNRIYRGSYHHIAGNEARCSVVHAIDVARAAVALAEKGGVYNLTDGIDPSRHDLAEALAHRLNSKKIFTLSEKRARRWALLNDFLPGTWLTRRNLRRELSTLTFDSSRARSILDFEPINTVDYLLNHNYDEDEF